ncbi:DUF3846 domain-containing protein [Mammaliicoccus sciuri]|uniref:DUF3846 domain-containing protein n=1 Tax=Mammaliicoccus sciuri TaxID=1296 RepID=UPI003F54D7F5
MTQAILYDNKTQTFTQVKMNEKDIPLELMYELIDCDMIELVSLTNDIDIFVDECGLLKNFTDINILHDLKTGFQHQMTGKMLFVTADEEDGSTIGLSDEQVKYIKDNVVIKTIPAHLFL